jgi:hypothetical protein
LTSHKKFLNEVEESINDVLDKYLKPISKPKQEGHGISPVASTTSGDENVKDEVETGKRKDEERWTLQNQLNMLERCSTQVQDDLIKPVNILGDMVCHSCCLTEQEFSNRQL